MTFKLQCEGFSSLVSLQFTGLTCDLLVIFSGASHDVPENFSWLSCELLLILPRLFVILSWFFMTVSSYNVFCNFDVRAICMRLFSTFVSLSFFPIIFQTVFLWTFSLDFFPVTVPWPLSGPVSPRVRALVGSPKRRPLRKRLLLRGKLPGSAKSVYTSSLGISKGEIFWYKNVSWILKYKKKMQWFVKIIETLI